MEKIGRAASGKPWGLRSPLVAGAALLILGTLVLYLPAIRSGYIWDDDAYVHNNPTLESPNALARIWFEPSASPQYYPLVFTSFWIERALWHENPLGFHLVNVLLHGLSALVLWRLLRRLSIPGAFLGACIFAFHPVHVESVAWITERKNVLSGLCYLASAWYFLRFAWPGSDSTARRRWTYLASLAIFACALLAKTTAATLPAAMLLVLAWKEGRPSSRRLLAVLPFLVCGIALGLHTAWMERHHVGASGEEWDLGFGERLLIAGHALVFYLQKLLVPLRLTFIYPRWPVGPDAIRQLPYLLGVALLLSGVVLARHRLGSGPLVAFLFFAGTLFPALGFLNVYPMRYAFVADHFQYLASIGPIALFAAGVTKGLVRSAAGAGLGGTTRPARASGARVLPVACTALVLAVLAGLTWHQQRDYRDIETLWNRTLQKNPRAWMAHNNLGTLAVERKEYERALGEFQQAIAANERMSNSHFNAGSVLNTLGRYPEAVPYLERATALRADYAEAQFALGLAYLRTGQPGRSAAPFAEALRLRPNWTEPMNGLAWVLVAYPDSAFTNPEAGVLLAEQAAGLTDRRDPYTLDTLAAAYAAAGRFGPALETLDQAKPLLEAAGDAASLVGLEQKKRLFAAGQPYREAP